jgi:cell division protein FtsI/penicillin-binding protein 2
VAIFILFGFFVIVARLFDLQILRGEEFQNLARAQRSTTIEIPARRGEILVRETQTGDLVKMATNTTLDLIFVDPKITPDKKLIAAKLAPFLFTEKDFENCRANFKSCPRNSVQILDADTGEILENWEENSADEFFAEKILRGKKILPDFATARKFYEREIFAKINREEIDFTVLGREIPDEKLDEIEKLFFPGIGINRAAKLVWADPTEIEKSMRKRIARQIAPILEKDSDEILRRISGGPLRYVKLKNRLDPEISAEIKKLKTASKSAHEKSAAEIVARKSDEKPTPDFWRGVGLIPEHFRYYPDGEIAAQIVGFTNHENIGQYGIEGKFDQVLAGKKGIIESQNDVSGMQISMGAEKIENAQNGASIVLTIDRIIQKKVEEILAEKVEKFKADSGQILVIEPFSGAILAMANFPTFDPNFFGNVYARRRTTAEDLDLIFETTPVFKKDENGRFVRSNFEEFKKAWELNFDPEFFVYKNWRGPESYLNKTVQNLYEPGSVFKPVAMAAALDTGEITPSTKFLEDGPIEVGPFEIHTANDEYHGWQTMTNALETSSNIGMARVALKLGKAVWHKYIKDFGLGEFTDIGLENELAGTVKFYKKWSDALLITSAFGQGIDATPLQIATAWCALANGGNLMKPRIVSEILRDGKIIQKNEPQKIRQVISADAAMQIKAMLVSSVTNGVARDAKVENYKIAGKTGTSQIARTDGVGYERAKEPGHVITSFAGFAPVDRPRFVVLVKFDRPHVSDALWGSKTAAPTFREVAKFLLDYFEIPADDAA